MPSEQTPDPVSPKPVSPAVVPTFSCIVYVMPGAAGGVRARVANLAGLECEAASERQALARLIPQFKQRMAELVQSNAPVPWIEPLPPLEPGEQQRFVPVHL